MNKARMKYSFTLLDDFAGCPKRAHHCRIVRDVVQVTTPQMLEGQQVHAALEARLRDQTPLPEKWAAFEKYCVSIETRGVPSVERRYAVTATLEPCAWDDPDAWMRGIVDVEIEAAPKAWLGDWKTGKVRDKPLQLSIFAWIKMLHSPAVDEVGVCNIFINHGKLGEPRRYTRANVAGITAELVSRTMEVERCLDKDQWPMRPTALCGWCPVVSCQHNPGKNT